MDRAFEEFLTAIDGVTDDEKIWSALCSAVGSLGFDKAIYLYYPNATGAEMGQPIFRTSYKDDWMQYWNHEGYNEVDIPVRRTIEAGFSPMTMDVSKYIDNPEVKEDDFAMLALYDANNEGGCDKVYSHQLFHGTTGLGAMGLVSNCMTSGEFEEVVDRHAPALSAIIHIAHASLSQGLVRSQELVPKLSGRQRDMLFAISRGMRYKEIAHHYGLSESTVSFHIAELRKKLGCNTSREIISNAHRMGVLKTV